MKRVRSVPVQLGLIPPRVLSYGGGLDSFAMLVEALRRGERPDMVVFVDVGDGDRVRDGMDPGEWPGTYRHLREVVAPLCTRERVEFVWLSSAEHAVRDARSLFAWLKARKQIPVSGPNRICTVIAKVERFEAWMRARFGSQQVEVWIGFDAAETARMEKDPNAGKPHALRRNRFPLVEWDLCRCRCEDLVVAAGYEVPQKSACVFCPYGTRGDFQLLAREFPRTFSQVVELESAKPPTRRGAKLSIKNFRTVTRGDGSKEYRATPLPELVRGTYRPRPTSCRVCGRGARAPKTIRCGDSAA